MNILVLLLIISFKICAGLRTSFELIQYNPLIFQLSFSKNITLPTFQIL